MDIQRIEEHDVATVAAFEREISEISFGDEAIVDLDFHIKKIKKNMDNKNNFMFTLKDGDCVIGWLWFYKRVNYLSEDVYIDFKSFYILEGCRSQEAHDRLMDKLFEVCQREQIKKIIGKVIVDNVAMRSLYKKYGFKPVHLTMEKSFE